ncbi:MAG: hypothetical protein GTO45_14750 [Candidatus Aminicenantes bacterium]|nr:hypothetical protein [Candidatus Aminicenantes bacterium]NIM80013.1 hypothetical protein [Candidatus Aminicenantes bacterium]NIN19367.1 hypothetical protein [Candidatus Aminicenantes bacterium]NIN43266.1 hypothetical protein [Candidatus Aminicenantes bacterium]NIN86008.1 hypothetical protein [Candidatus Aminicenantes bacterium]
MKRKRSENRLVDMLNKETIAHLNHREMVNLLGGWEMDQDDNLNNKIYVVEETTGCYPLPITTDGGITPFDIDMSG